MKRGDKIQNRDELFLLNEIPAIIGIYDIQFTLVFFNDFARDFFGIDPNESKPISVYAVFHPDDHTHLTALTHAAAAPQSITLRVRRKEGAWIWVQCSLKQWQGPDKTGIFYSIVCTDIDRLKQKEALLADSIEQSPAVGLPNRVLFERLLANLIEKAHGVRYKIPVLIFALDRFQVINETFGHDGGDLVLQEIGNRLAALGSALEVTGHLTGNRFLIIGPMGRDAATAHDTAAHLRQLCHRPFYLGDIAHDFTGSIGISLFPEDGESPHELLRAAEAALQTAKSNGGNTHIFYDRALHGQAKKQFDLELDLRKAIPNGELVLFFQPKVRLPDFRLVGFEALIRWNHPERGLLPPVLFIGLAEKSDLIRALTRFVFEAVAKQQAAWIAAGLTPVPIAVNVSAREFLHRILDEHLPAYLAYTLPPGLLEVEITESTMIEDFDHVCRIVKSLQAAEIKVGMDDFGTGYSSLASLNRLPIASLKIDRAFTKDLDWDRASRAVASAIISMAREMGLEVIAEGVETKEQLAILRQLNCKIIQGYLTGYPVPADTAEAYLRQPCPIPGSETITADRPLHPSMALDRKTRTDEGRRRKRVKLQR